MSKERDQLIKELEGLSELRDRALEMWSYDDLVERFFSRHINIFTSTFFFAIVELTEDVSSLDKTYTTYFRTRNSPLRFLAELYLTTIHVAAGTKDERTQKAFTFIVSGKIYIHRIELKLEKIAKQNGLNRPDLQKKLNENRSNYVEFITEFPMPSFKMPPTIDEFFDGTEVVKDFDKIFNFRLFKHGKINYMAEIENNPLIPALVRDFLLFQYPLWSLDAHPTHNSLVDFDEFIAMSPEEKRNTASGRIRAGQAFLELFSKQMKDITGRLMDGDLKIK